MLYVKIIGENFGNYPYRIGLNTLTYNGETFDERPICVAGGLYFTTADHIFEYIDYGDKVCLLTIPNDAHVVSMYKKCKSDRIIIREILPLWNIDTIRLLLSMGADIHANSDSVILHACYRGFLDIVQYLVYMGATLSDELMYIARCYKHTSVVDYLLDIQS